MIDIETIATTPNSAIITIAAVRFDALARTDKMETLELLIDVDDCMGRGFDVDPNTLDWWGKQSPEAQYAAFEKGPRLLLPDALTSLSRFVFNTQRLWCQGMNFDPVILENAYRKIGQTVPWMYWKWRDSRTLLSLLAELPKKDSRAHDAVYDAVWQAKLVQQVLQTLKVEGIR
jgi:hypothetical protein